jgi:hypothetical protein
MMPVVKGRVPATEARLLVKCGHRRRRVETLVLTTGLVKESRAVEARS